MSIYNIFEELAFIASEYDESNLNKEIEIIVPINYYYEINKALKKEILFTSTVDHNIIEPNITALNTRCGVTFKFKIKDFDYE